MVEVEFAQGETCAGLHRFESRGGGAGGRGFDALPAGDEHPALEMPGVAHDEGTCEALLIQDVLGFFQVLRVGCARSFSPVSTSAVTRPS